jgi:viroplasmin and RNaseH domain-containing protein
MAIIYGENDEIIETEFPQDKYWNYLKRLQVKKTEDLTSKQKQILFMTAIKDFKKGVLSVDELSDIAGEIWQNTRSKSSELMQQLYYASELSYQLRHITGDNDTFVWFMKEVMDYYEKFKLRALV